MIYGFNTSIISSSPVSVCIASSIGLERSRLKIPISDLASMTYLPDNVDLAIFFQQGSIKLQCPVIVAEHVVTVRRLIILERCFVGSPSGKE